ncbi:hypothetical protein PGT21_035167 [Puccinia graminis f. sp. tritici]|uniref:Uncharacterized protein n=1 Tax=Puccinia graminis f. sp. tritici TaxID=56615 RepID=A0A5B0R2N6_PUCGR|nr:hypothetical protein PGT21_035167 [Puccinia graminis f. sp. tritici]
MDVAPHSGGASDQDLYNSTHIRCGLSSQKEHFIQPGNHISWLLWSDLYEDRILPLRPACPSFPKIGKSIITSSSSHIDNPSNKLTRTNELYPEWLQAANLIFAGLSRVMLPKCRASVSDQATTPPPTPSIRVPWLGGLPINPHHYAAAPPVTSRGTKARARS